MEALFNISLSLAYYKYALLFPVVVIEGPIITIIAGLLVASGQLNFWLTFFVVILGDLLGDIFYYLLGRFSIEKIRSNWLRFAGLTPERVSAVVVHFGDHGGKTLFVGKLSHGIGTVFLVAAGLAKMPVLQFLWYDSLATIFKSFVLLCLGYYYGNALSTIKSTLDIVALVVVSSVLAGVIVYWFLHKDKNAK